MRYPTISQYIDALNQPELFVQRLKGISLLLGDAGRPIYSSGNFGVVFKVQLNSKTYALKCFTREQIGRAEAYSKITKALPVSQHLIKVEYLDREILIAPHGEPHLRYYDLLLMEYVEGQTLANKLQMALKTQDTELLLDLSIKFNELALWLLNQEFAHGDLKPENILISEDGEIQIVDYDGVYTPEMRGERQREIGTRAYQHPKRAEMNFSKEIDHYSVLLISVSLYLLALDPSYYTRFGSSSTPLLINPWDAVDGNSPILDYIEGCKILPSGITEFLRCETPIWQGMEQAIATIGQLSLELKASRTGSDDQVDMLPFEDNMLWGYENQNGAEVITPRFQMAWEFDENGLALVKIKGRYGYINPTGEFVIKPRFQYAAPFSEGVAVASIKGRYGYIDTQGRWLVRPKYSFARSVRSGVARVEVEGGDWLEFNVDKR